MVLSLSWLTTLSLGVVAVTGIITPLGLSDRVEPITPRGMPFVYAPDQSAFGLVTPPRPDVQFSRQCGGINGFIVCPGSQGTDAYVPSGGSDITIVPGAGNYSTRIPRNITEIFMSATSYNGSTVSGIFDIQYRQHYPTSLSRVDNNQSYTVGYFRSGDILLLHDKIEPVEGLIVDSKNGGVELGTETIPSLLAFKRAPFGMKISPGLSL